MSTTTRLPCFLRCSQIFDLGDDITGIRCLDWDRDRFDIEFGLQARPPPPAGRPRSLSSARAPRTARWPGPVCDRRAGAPPKGAAASASVGATPPARPQNGTTYNSYVIKGSDKARRAAAGRPPHPCLLRPARRTVPAPPSPEPGAAPAPDRCGGRQPRKIPVAVPGRAAGNCGPGED